LLRGDPFLDGVQICNTPCFLARKIVELRLHRVLPAHQVCQRHLDLLESTLLARLLAHQVEGELLVFAQRIARGFEASICLAQGLFTIYQTTASGIGSVTASQRNSAISLKFRL